MVFLDRDLDLYLVIHLDQIYQSVSHIRISTDIKLQSLFYMCLLNHIFPIYLHFPHFYSHRFSPLFFFSFFVNVELYIYPLRFQFG